MSRMKKEERNENAEKKRGVSRFTPYALIGPAMALMAVFVFYPLADVSYRITCNNGNQRTLRNP